MITANDIVVGYLFQSDTFAALMTILERDPEQSDKERILSSDQMGASMFFCTTEDVVALLNENKFVLVPGKFIGAEEVEV